MTRLRSICFLCAVFVIGTTVFAEPIPLSSGKKTQTAEKNKSGTRHDHANGGADCQYVKGAWSECNLSANIKTRTLTLKKGQDETKCEKVKTVEKKCKKVRGCKYEKGAWSKCNSNNEMTRTDNLRNPNESDVSCEKTKLITKTCKNKSKTDRNNNKGQQKRKHKQQQDATNKDK